MRNILNGKLTYIVGFLMIVLGGLDVAFKYFGMADILSINGEQLFMEGLGFIGLKRAVVNASA